MASLKAVQAIEAIKQMPDNEADTVVTFIAGLKAGAKINMANQTDQPRKPPADRPA